MNGNKFKKNSFFIVRLENTTKIIMSSKNSKIQKFEEFKNYKKKIIMFEQVFVRVHEIKKNNMN